ncbi:hypothetical protein B0T24DRAFT_325263 [Lasiosphaeria ovina]|uniref:Uncharacterized protein n=1 Tax=Lasiosphaeria ovina TaxID=92902 RepID=A0AAE0K7N5_9PEZI|nr:hypothetical protein B0T24DRAFT_325263 [Lasiosphaeria ovina]
MGRGLSFTFLFLAGATRPNGTLTFFLSFKGWMVPAFSPQQTTTQATGILQEGKGTRDQRWGLAEKCGREKKRAICGITFLHRPSRPPLFYTRRYRHCVDVAVAIPRDLILKQEKLCKSHFFPSPIRYAQVQENPRGQQFATIGSRGLPDTRPISPLFLLHCDAVA